MGKQQPIEMGTDWQLDAGLLDATFPLADGSHRAVADYLVHCGHLLVIRTDGSCTGLARPGQFVEADGDESAPQAVLLEQDGLQVEIEPSGRRPAMPGERREHRLQMLTALAAIR